MQLGSFYVPDMRLISNAIPDTKKIYDVVKKGQIETKEIGSVFKYKNYNTGVFYRRLNSMVEYGLIEQLGRSSYRITDLGEELAYPDPQKEDALKTKSVLHVALWNEIFKKYGKDPPTDTFWIQLRNITNIDPKEAQKIQSQIRKWYVDDIALVKLDELGHPILDISNDTTQSQKGESLRSSHGNSKPLQQQLTPLQISEDNVIIPFGKASLSLPKKDLKKQWERLQKHMELYLEDYEESNVGLEDLSEEDQDVIRDMQIEGTGD